MTKLSSKVLVKLAPIFEQTTDSDWLNRKICPRTDCKSVGGTVMVDL